MVEKNIQTRWVRGKTFVSTVENGHAVITDAPTVVGGHDTAQTPMEMLLSAAASCASFDIVTIMDKQRQPLSSCTVSLEALQSETAPKVFTKVHFIFEVSGEKVTDKAVEKALQLTFDTHCAVSITMARGGTELTWEYKIV